MRTLSEKYEDFESKKDEESDALYNFDQPKVIYLMTNSIAR